MFQGSMVALVTPMHDDGAVDFDALKGLVDFHVDNNTAAIISVGTTGESATLDPEEHCDVVEQTYNMRLDAFPSSPAPALIRPPRQSI